MVRALKCVMYTTKATYTTPQTFTPHDLHTKREDTLSSNIKSRNYSQLDISWCIKIVFSVYGTDLFPADCLCTQQGGCSTIGVLSEAARVNVCDYLCSCLTLNQELSVFEFGVIGPLGFTVLR